MPRASQSPLLLLLLLLLPLQGVWWGIRHPKPETRHHWREQDRSTQLATEKRIIALKNKQQRKAKPSEYLPVLTITLRILHHSHRSHHGAN